MSFPEVELPDAPGFVVGHGDRPHLGMGWWDRQEWPGRPGLHCRTAHPWAQFRLAGRPPHRHLKLLLAASVRLIGAPCEVDVLCDVDTAGPRLLGRLVIPWEDWAVHAVPCEVTAAAPLVFTLRTLTPCVPDAVLHNGDHRRLGVHLAAAHLC